MRDWLLGLSFNRYWHARVIVGVVAVIDFFLYLYDLTMEWLGKYRWGVFDEDTGVHVLPLSDHIEHHLDSDCICGPDIEWTDPDTDETYENGPLVTHHSLDGREQAEVEAVRHPL